MSNHPHHLLPPLMQDIANIVGFDDTLKLAKTYGGTRIHVPVDMNTHHKFATLLGMEQAQKMRAAFQGETIVIAQCTNYFKQQRNTEIIKQYNNNTSTHTLARENGLTERQIYTILSKT